MLFPSKVLLLSSSLFIASTQIGGNIYGQVSLDNPLNIPSFHQKEFSAKEEGELEYWKSLCKKLTEEIEKLKDRIKISQQYNFSQENIFSNKEEKGSSFDPKHEKIDSCYEQNTAYLKESSDKAYQATLQQSLSQSYIAFQESEKIFFPEVVNKNLNSSLIPQEILNFDHSFIRHSHRPNTLFDFLNPLAGNQLPDPLLEKDKIINQKNRHIRRLEKRIEKQQNSFQSKMRSMGSKIQRITREKKELKEALKETNQQVIALTNEKSSLEETLGEANLKITPAQNQIAVLAQRIEETEGEKEENERIARNDNQTLLGRLENLNNELDQKEENLRKKGSQIESLRNALKQVSKNYRKLSRRSALEVNTLKETLLNKARTAFNLQEEIDLLKNQKNALQESYHQLHDNYTLLEEEKENQKQALQNHILRHEAEKETLDRRYQEIVSSYKDEKEKNLKLIEDLSSLWRVIKNNQEEETVLQNQIINLETKIKKIETKAEKDLAYKDKRHRRSVAFKARKLEKEKLILARTLLHTYRRMRSSLSLTQFINTSLEGSLKNSLTLNLKEVHL